MRSLSWQKGSKHQDMARKALLIGVSNYELSRKQVEGYDLKGFEDLPSVKSDLNNLERVLGNPDMGAFQVERLDEPTRTKMLTSISKFLDNCDNDDLALIYFSGHGVKTQENELYFATVDTVQRTESRRQLGKGELETATAASAAEVYKYITKATQVKSKILILDCCFSGAFDPIKKGGQESLEIVKQLETVEGVVILTSSDSTAYSYASLSDMKMSAFTHFLVQGIEAGEADKNLRGKITIGDLYHYVEKQFNTKNIAQRPRMLAKDKGSDIEIAESPRTNQEAWLKDELVTSVAQDVKVKPSPIGIKAPDYPEVIRWIDGKVMLLVKPYSQEWFYIDKYPVTASQYIAYLKLRNQVVNWQSFWMQHNWFRAADFPVTDVSIEEVKRYAEYVKKKLPTLTQWCLGATGGVEPFTVYPWGNQFKENCCNSKEYWSSSPDPPPKYSHKPEPTPIDRFPVQNSIGVYDIVGNVIEVAFCESQNRWFQMGGCHQNSQLEIQIVSGSKYLSPYFQATPNIGFRCVAGLEDYKHLTLDAQLS